MLIPKIDVNSRILSVSHNDLDGVTCQILLGQVYKNIKYVNASFYKVDDVLKTINYDEYDYVFLTDIHPDKKENLYLSNKIVMIDHHESAKDMHDPDKFHYVITDACASVYVKMFLESIYRINLSKFNSLVYLTNDYDTYTRNNSKSTMLYDLEFNHYKPAKFRKRFFDGNTRLTKEEIAWVRQRMNEFDKMWDELEVFELDKVHGCVIEVNNFVNELADKLIKTAGYRIVFVRNPYTGRISIRHNMESFDVGKLLKERGWGGGHKKAAGAFADSYTDFKYKVDEIEAYLAENYKESIECLV